MLLALLALPAAGRAGNYLSGPQDSYKVFVIGDSLAGGLWAGLARQVREDDRLTVSGRFKEDSGLARPEIYDWPRALGGILERNLFDIAVVIIGANDGRDIRRGADRFTYGSEDWAKAYRENVANLLDVLKRAKVAVYWVGLPPMRASEIDAVAQTVTALQRAAMEEAGIRFIDIRAQFANADGSYAENGFDVSGEFTRLRSRNGVNLLRSGNDKLAEIVLEVVRADMAAAQGLEAAGSSAESDNLTPAPRRRLAYEGPVFGKALANGEVTQIQSQDLPSPDAVAVARQALPGEGDQPDDPKRPGDVPAKKDETADLASPLPDARPGSQAERLFATGQWPPPEPGRIDDFSMPQ